MIRTPIKGELCVCPICKKEFKASDDTKYICRGGYTCSWGCFLDNAKNPDKYEPHGNTTPPPTPKIVDNPKKIEYNKGTKAKVDLFSVEEPPKKRDKNQKGVKKDKYVN